MKDYFFTLLQRKKPFLTSFSFTPYGGGFTLLHRVKVSTLSLRISEIDDWRSFGKVDMMNDD